MQIKQELLTEIFGAIDDLNQQIPADRQLAKGPDTLLMGTGSGIDSLETVNFVVALESRIEKKYGLELMIYELMTSTVERQSWKVEDLAALLQERIKAA